MKGNTDKPERDLVKQQYEVAVTALLEIKRHTQGGNGAPTMRAFVTARDALVALKRNPEPAKRG